MIIFEDAVYAEEKTRVSICLQISYKVCDDAPGGSHQNMKSRVSCSLLGQDCLKEAPVLLQ